jgi:hypothetical protein
MEMQLMRSGRHSPILSRGQKVAGMLIDFVITESTTHESFVIGDKVAPGAPQNLVIEQ